jgi:hypothetical protein
LSYSGQQLQGIRIVDRGPLDRSQHRSLLSPAYRLQHPLATFATECSTEKRAGGLCLRHVTWGRVCHITRGPHTQPPAIVPTSLIVYIDIMGHVPATAEKYTWVSPGTFSGGGGARQLPCKLTFKLLKNISGWPLHSEQKNILIQKVLETCIACFHLILHGPYGKRHL